MSKLLIHGAGLKKILHNKKYSFIKYTFYLGEIVLKNAHFSAQVLTQMCHKAQRLGTGTLMKMLSLLAGTLLIASACSPTTPQDDTTQTTPAIGKKTQKGGGGGGAYVPVFCEQRDGMGGWPMGACLWNFAERSVGGGVVWQCEAPAAGAADICQIMDPNIPGGTDEIKWSRPPEDQHWNPGLKLFEALFSP